MSRSLLNFNTWISTVVSTFFGKHPNGTNSVNDISSNKSNKNFPERPIYFKVTFPPELQYPLKSTVQYEEKLF